MARPSTPSFKLPLRVWDLPVRAFHWLLVVLMLVSYASVTFATGDNARLLMKIHIWSGEAVLCLLLFRIIWGFIGSETARFVTFMRSPLAALAHLSKMRQRSEDTQIGHNEAGGWMVLIMLALLLTQVGTGLFSNDDGSSEGPLAQFISKEMSDTLSGLHSVNFNFLIGAVALHVIAIVLYARLRGHNLLMPMLTGKKRLAAATKAPRMGHPLLAVLSLTVSAVITVAIARL